MAIAKDDKGKKGSPLTFLGLLWTSPSPQADVQLGIAAPQDKTPTWRNMLGRIVILGCATEQELQIAVGRLSFAQTRI